MKTILLILSVLFFVSVFSQVDATTTSTATITEPVAAPMLADGVRFSLVKPFFELTETLMILNSSGGAKADYESAGGIAIGYAHLPELDFGYIAQLAFYEANMDVVKDSLNFARASVNLALSPDFGVSLLAGLNTMKYINNSNLEALNLQVGWQAGLNFQFNENFSIGVQYYDMNTSGLVEVPAIGRISREINTRGVEIDAGVTF